MPPTCHIHIVGKVCLVHLVHLVYLVHLVVWKWIISVCFFVNKRTNDKLLSVQWANCKHINENRLGFHFPVSPCPRPLCPYIHVSMSPFLHVSCLHVYVSCFHVFMFPCGYLHVSRIPQTENGTNGKWKLPTVCCKQKTEMANFCSFAANRNGKRKFLLVGLKTINATVSVHQGPSLIPILLGLYQFKFSYRGTDRF